MKQWNNHRMILHWFAVVLVISISPLWASAAEFFVATTGNDSNSGTINSPFRTLEKAASVMVSGDTMNIRAGTYRRTAWSLNVPSGGGSWSTATTIKAYNKEKVIITPQDPTQNGTDVIRLPSGKSYIIFDGLILDGLRNGTTNGGRMAFRFHPDTVGNPSHHVRIINTEMRYTYTVLLYTSNATHNEFINLNLHHGAHNLPPDPDGGCKSSPTPFYCFRVYGIYMASGNNLVMNCDIHHNQGHGISQYSAHAFQPHNNTYIANKIHHNHWAGMVLGRGDNTLIYNNLIYENGYGSEDIVGRTPFGSRVGLYTNGPNGRPTRAINTQIFNNTFYGNRVGELTINSPSVTAKNNIFYGTGTSAAVHIRLDLALNAVTQNNVIYHADPSKYVWNTSGHPATISNNINADPLFVDGANADFHLTSVSPVIDKGMTLNEVKYDFDNIRREEPFDIGAYTFIGSSVSIDTTSPASPKDVRIH